ncbi:superoxide dismutase family protein [Nonomuraea typhae]|uniref:Superoxide dismutase family protein n=1 Tax=Nonomuraea typhae TaxID=2603600 RepID=A0ABW7YTC8_9ACTN
MRWAPVVLLSVLAAACAQTAEPVTTSPAGAITISGGGSLTDADTAAIAYDRKLAPAGAQASATAESVGPKTTSSLVVEGLLPARAYGAHLHTKPCGAKPDDAGPHFQHHPDGATAANEVWLDLTTDAEGAGRATARHSWPLDRARLPQSLVIHAQATVSSGPDAGTAGPRVACLTLR